MEAASTPGNPLVILNPTANRGKMAFYRALIRKRVEGERVEYVETTRRGEAKERAMEAAREGQPIVVVGGDGTVHEVVNGILGAGRAVPPSNRVFRRDRGRQLRAWSQRAPGQRSRTGAAR